MLTAVPGCLRDAGFLKLNEDGSFSKHADSNGDNGAGKNVARPCGTFSLLHDSCASAIRFSYRSSTYLYKIPSGTVMWMGRQVHILYPYSLSHSLSPSPSLAPWLLRSIICPHGLVRHL